MPINCVTKFMSAPSIGNILKQQTIFLGVMSVRFMIVSSQTLFSACFGFGKGCRKSLEKFVKLKVLIWRFHCTLL